MRRRNFNYSKLLKVLDSYRDSRNRIIVKKNSIFYKKLLEHFDFCNNISEIYYALENNLYKKNKCLYCENDTSTVKSKTCSSRVCRNKFVSTKIDYNKRNKTTRDVLLQKYGVVNVSQIPEVKSKIKNTMKEKYGTEYFFGSNSHKEILKNNNPTLKVNNIKNLENLTKEYIIENFLIHGKIDVERCLEYFNISITTLNRYKINLNIDYNNYFKSSQNIEHKINSEFKNEFLNSDRVLIKPYEIDLLSNKYKFGIEYNGLLWHSYGTSYPYNMDINKNRHLEKTKLVEEKGYQLFHIFENEWLDPIKKEIWKSVINNKLHLNNKIYARNCEIKEVSTNEAMVFENANHLQGSGLSSIKLGLYYNNELVSLMTFGKSRYNKNFEYELIRFCSKINNNVIGGANKLLKYFETTYKPKSLISYANRRWSKGDLYEKLGFSFINNSTPNWFLFKVKDLILMSRVQFQKHKLKYKLEVFDENKTADENIFDNGYRKIFDCGNKVYIKEYNEN